MEYITLPKNYFEITEEERLELANDVAMNQTLNMSLLIKEESLEWVEGILNKRLNHYISIEEYEQADFMEKIINCIIKNFNDESGV